jgi:uncharacterized protein YprB with RNaseH-like and TPR domain/predicted nuclease with RNAse H fold/dephospho-CoA kinase
MIKQTFQHIEGFSDKKELDLWRKNIFSWDEYEKQYGQQESLFDYQNANPFYNSRNRFEHSDYEYFVDKLPKHLYYRIAHSFPERTLFLDIETTGLSRYYDEITMIGWSFNNEFKYSISLDEKKIKELKDNLKKASCIVTFNGTLFDIPFIKSKIEDIEFPKCHIDLRFFCRRNGFSGGQKNIENELKIKRPKDLKEVTGREAIILWYQYKEGDNNALRQLIKYNAYDIFGMKKILEIVSKVYIDNLGLPKRKFSLYNFSNLDCESKINFDKLVVPDFDVKNRKNVYLNNLGKIEDFRVIGIDLTGSEKRATGWAYIENGKAITKRINMDEDLINETIKTNPHVISIDSPLSLPIGRVTPFDDDPGRKEFGILRECERIMKRRGINSYPCLIQSMQKLTERGIKLADIFRKKGFVVIESYPGAAQDIMGIPRKGLSLDFLVKGLREFGIYGDFDSKETSHDEIDAITSAVVGYFFLTDKYEALGNEIEDYLIIPNLEIQPKPAIKKVIGISGAIASGKTTLGKILEKNNYIYSRYSLVLKNKLIQSGKNVNRTNLQEYGEYINEQKGQRWLGKQLLNQYFDKNYTEYLVIDGLRFLENISFLRERFGVFFQHVHIEAKKDIRKKRYMFAEENYLNFEEAIKHEVERESETLKEKADVIIKNNGTIEELEESIKYLI